MGQKWGGWNRRGQEGRSGEPVIVVRPGRVLVPGQAVACRKCRYQHRLWRGKQGDLMVKCPLHGAYRY